MASNVGVSNRFPQLSDDPNNVLATTVRDSSGVHVPMQFIIGQKAINFTLNPQDIQEDLIPVESEVPTTGGWFTYRWLVAPTEWNLNAYCGLAGLGLINGLNSLVGEIDVVWHFPYLGPNRNVKIMKIRRMYGAKSPYGFRYSIQMRENTPFVSVTKDPISQFRITTSLVALTQNNLNPGGSTSNVAQVPAQPTWTSLNQVAQWAASYSSIKMPAQADEVFRLNLTPPNGTGSMPGPDWNVATGPLDVFGRPIKTFLYNPGYTK